MPRLRGMHSRLLVFGLPRSLPPLSPSPAPPCLPFVEGRQRAAPHSSSFPPTTAPLQTLHMDVWGPARVICLQLRERFREDLSVLRLHSDRGGEFSLDLLRDFCREEGILQSFMLPASPKENGVAECRIGLVMELNLWPRVSLPETSPTLRWTGKVGDTSVFRVWSSCAFVRDTSADKLSARAIPCVFLGFPPDAPGWQFYHPTSRRVLPSHDVTFDESVPFYCLFPYRTAPLPPPPPLFLAPGPPPQGLAPSGVSQVDPLPVSVLVKVAVDSGAARGAASGGAASRGAASGVAEPERAEPRGAKPKGAEPGGAESEGAESGGVEPGGTEPEGAEPRGAESEGAESGGDEPRGAEPGGTESKGAESGGAEPRGTASAGGARGSTAEGIGAVGAGVTAKAGGTGGAGAARPGGARIRGTGAARAAGVAGAGGGDPGAGGAGTRGAGAGGTGAGDPGVGGAGAGGSGVGGPGAGGTVQRHPFFVPPLPLSLPPPKSVLSLPSSTGITPSLLCPPPHQSQQQLQPDSPLPAPSPYTEQTDSHTVCHEPVSCAALPVRAVRTDRRDPESDLARTARLTVPRLLATVVIDPSFESTAACALVSELVDFAAACCLNYAASLVAESEFDYPPSIRTGMDTKMASWKSTGTYVDAVPPFGANIVDGMWIFRVKQPPGSPPVFKARYVARGFRQRQGVDFFHTFSPTPKMTTLWVLQHVVAQRDYELHSLDVSTTFLEGSLHEEI
ncbi:unnamed protein product [Closterium sp. NIES-54]